MELLARARIVMWQGANLWIVDATPLKERETKRTDFHAHHAIQVTLALDGWFRLDTNDAHVRGNAAAVAVDVEHAFEPDGLMAILFIEPESRWDERWRTHCSQLFEFARRRCGGFDRRGRSAANGDHLKLCTAQGLHAALVAAFSPPAPFLKAVSAFRHAWGKSGTA